MTLEVLAYPQRGQYRTMWRKVADKASNDWRKVRLSNGKSRAYLAIYSIGVYWNGSYHKPSTPHFGTQRYSSECKPLVRQRLLCACRPFSELGADLQTEDAIVYSPLPTLIVAVVRRFSLIIFLSPFRILGGFPSGVSKGGTRGRSYLFETTSEIGN